jgi:hypothetical protein
MIEVTSEEAKDGWRPNIKVWSSHGGALPVHKVSLTPCVFPTESAADDAGILAARLWINANGEARA